VTALALEQVQSRVAIGARSGPPDIAARPYQSEGWPGRVYPSLETALGGVSGSQTELFLWRRNRRRAKDPGMRTKRIVA